jgi:hypothetical protein
MHWHLGGFGSAMFVWDVGSATLEIPSSYIGDALGDLMQTALDLKKGARSSFCHFLGEPGGHRVFFSGAGVEVYVQVVRFPNLDSEHGRWAGATLVWAGRVSTRRFVESVVDMATDLIRNLGEDGYQRTWGRPFPTELLSALR